jgi:hypothetical protein
VFDVVEAYGPNRRVEVASMDELMRNTRVYHE